SLAVVSFCVHHQSRPAARKYRVRIIAHGDIGRHHRTLRLSLHIGDEVRYVAGMGALCALQSMMLAIGIEVSTRGFEVRPFALRSLMHVDGMIARRQIVQIQLDGHAVVCGGELGRSHTLSLSVLQVDGYGLGPLVFSPGRGKDGKQQSGTKDELPHFAYLSWRSARRSKRWPVPGGHCN